MIFSSNISSFLAVMVSTHALLLVNAAPTPAPAPGIISRTKDRYMAKNAASKADNPKDAAIAWVDMTLKNVQISNTKKGQFSDAKSLRDKIIAQIPDPSNKDFYQNYSDAKVVAACVCTVVDPADKDKIAKYLAVRGKSQKQLIDNCVRELGSKSGDASTASITPAAAAPAGGSTSSESEKPPAAAAADEPQSE